MKKFIFILSLFLTFTISSLYAEDEIKASKGGISEIPNSKRPKPIDKEKAEKAAEKDESEKDYENKSNTT